MARSIYKYTVYDKLLEKNVIVGGTVRDVSELVELKSDKIAQYCNKQWVCKKRYLISRERLDSKRLEEQATKAFIPQELAEEWDRVRFMLNPKAKRCEVRK